MTSRSKRYSLTTTPAGYNIVPCGVNILDIDNMIGWYLMRSQCLLDSIFVFGRIISPPLLTVTPLSNRRNLIFPPRPGVHILGVPGPNSVSEYVQYLSYSGVTHHRRQYTTRILSSCEYQC